jgi:hypothetical protein
VEIIDESDRARTLAERAFVGPRQDRPAALELLREFCGPAVTAAEAELFRLGDPGPAISAAVEAYREQRRNVIAYRRRAGLPVDEGTSR